jgi:predicted nucleic acid-binding protein
MKSSIFVDTSGWYAAIANKDHDHLQQAGFQIKP